MGNGYSILRFPNKSMKQLILNDLSTQHILNSTFIYINKTICILNYEGQKNRKKRFFFNRVCYDNELFAVNLQMCHLSIVIKSRDIKFS